MKILVNHLGPIKNNTQSIDLSKQFYVFVGENNSGKTYLSQLLWGVYHFAKIIDRAPFMKQLGSLNILDKLFDTPPFIPEQVITFNVEIDKTIFQLAFDYYSKFLVRGLPFIFKLPNNKPYFSNTTIQFQIEEEDIQKWNTYVGSRGETIENNVIFSINKLNNSLSCEISIGKISSEDAYLQRIIQVKEILIHFIINSISSQKNNLFLPANRQFYPIFYQYIFMLERRNEDDIFVENQKRLERPYTLPIANLLDKIFSINLVYNSKLKKNTYGDLLKQLSAIMGGDVRTERLEGIGISEFSFHTKNKVNIPLFLSSSAVNQLTLLYLYFKYWVKNDNNILFIDEPEENLHPKNQIKLLELLIEFANLNENKVFINTHSPLLADALNNYLYLNTLKNDMGMDTQNIMEENNISYINPNVTIPKEKVGVYFFDGEKIIDYETDNYGLFFRDFKEVTNSISKANRILTDYIYLNQHENEEV